MNDWEKRSIELALVSTRYAYRVDQYRIATVLRGLRTEEEREYARQIVRAGMKDTLRWRTSLQRKWQRQVSRRKGRSKQGSWEVRERYVRGDL